MRYLGKSGGVDKFECAKSEVRYLPKGVFIANNETHAKPVNDSVAFISNGDIYTFNGSAWKRDVKAEKITTESVETGSVTADTVTVEEAEGISIKSSTEGSEKRFKVKVIDDATISAEEETE